MTTEAKNDETEHAFDTAHATVQDISDKASDAVAHAADAVGTVAADAVGTVAADASKVANDAIAPATKTVTGTLDTARDTADSATSPARTAVNATTEPARKYPIRTVVTAVTIAAIGGFIAGTRMKKP